jgi:ribonucleoside-diphosphate reductase alpha chain
MQAAFQVSVDSGISKTINFDNSATLEDVENAYMLAWAEKCKGITVYRAGSRDKEVMVKGNGSQEKQSFTVGLTESISDVLIENDTCCATPFLVMESGCETCKSCGWSACLIA